MKNTTKLLPEVRERVVHTMRERCAEHESQCASVVSSAGKFGCIAQTLHTWVRRHERDTGQREGPTTADLKRVKELERQVKELRRANEIPRQRTPALCSDRAQCDAVLVEHVERVWRASLQVHGAWRQLHREGHPLARCTAERLMRRHGLRGVVSVKAVRTTISDAKASCPLEQVSRHFKAHCPNRVWVSDFIYVSTWLGWLYVAFVVNVFARCVVGWRVSNSMHSDFVPDTLEQALMVRQPERDDSVIHHSDRGSQYVSDRQSEHLAEAGIEPSVGSKGDSYDNALAEMTNRLCMAERIHRAPPWKTKALVELATLEWVSWFSHHRLLAPIGYVPQAETEAHYYRQLSEQANQA